MCVIISHHNSTEEHAWLGAFLDAGDTFMVSSEMTQCIWTPACTFGLLVFLMVMGLCFHDVFQARLSCFSSGTTDTHTCAHTCMPTCPHVCKAHTHTHTLTLFFFSLWAKKNLLPCFALGKPGSGSYQMASN